MPKANESSRLAWLAAVWSDQRHKISSLLARIAGLGAVQAMKPKIFAKFLRLLEQVALAMDEEVRLISEIDAIERKHRFQRNHGFLKRMGAEKEKNSLQREHGPANHLVESENQKTEALADETHKIGYHQECERPVSNWLWLAQAQKLHDTLTAVEAAGPPAQRSNNWMLWLVVFWFLMSRPAITPKSQSLTVD